MTGLEQITLEMQRQHADAVESFATSRQTAEKIADSIRTTGRLLLLGMGGSHWVNRTAMFSYRALGIEVQTEVLSEVLLRPFPDGARTVIVTSQSGNSGEISHYLEANHSPNIFGITLNAASVLGKAVPSLTGAGGPEKAFAATRSIFLSHAMHLAVMHALGANVGNAVAALAEPPPPVNLASAVTALAKCNTIILSGRSELQGAAESGALCLMELARMTTYALEGGQLRHGPIEMLNDSSGLIFLAAEDTPIDLLQALVKDCADIGCSIIVINASRAIAFDHAITISVPPSQGMEAVVRILPVLQTLLVQIADAKVENVGTPIRSTKVTTKL
jgi:fructoselysine-6-P-deglycase FrlB-like protein